MKFYAEIIPGSPVDIDWGSQALTEGSLAGVTFQYYRQAYKSAELTPDQVMALQGHASVRLISMGLGASGSEPST